MTSAPVVWVTRTLPWATRTSAKLRRLGCEPIVAPLLTIRPLETPIDLEGVGALAFTSAHGVATFAQARAERRLPVFAVGDGTAQAAREMGFKTVFSAGGDLGDLTRLIGHHRGDFSGTVLRPGALQPAGDIEAALAPLGVRVVSLAVYEAAPTPPQLILSTLAGVESLAAILIHSPRAGVELARLAGQLPAAPAVVVCISAAAAAPLADVPLTVKVAAQPTEEAMQAALAEQIATRG